jgi:zinc finger protein
MSEQASESVFFPKIGSIAGSDHVDDNAAPFAVNEESVSEIPNSLCMDCGETGVTKLLLMQIPYFREVVLMSFACDECGFKNTEVQFGGEIKEKGCKHRLRVTSAEDLNRQVIKSDTASLLIEELEFEIPAATQKGVINTLQGIINKAVAGLSEGQRER